MSLRYRARLAPATAAVVVAGALSAGVAQPASANPISPGSSNVAPDVYTTSPGTLVTSEGFNFSGSLAGDGSYTEYVYKAGAGQGLCTNCLNYIITIHTDPGAEITQIDLSDFAPGAPLDAGYNTELGLGQTGAPEYVGELSNGTVTFAYSPALNSQGTTDYLEMETSTTGYANTGGVCFNSNQSCESGYEPNAPVSEPASLSLLGSTLFGFGWFTSRRRTL